MSIEIRGLNFSYNKKLILKNIYIHIKKGRLTALMGENGSGKTTLLKTLLGINAINSGEIFVDGKSIVMMKDIDRARYFSYIPQSIQSVYDFYAIDVVLFGLAGELGLLQMPQKEERNRAEHVFCKLGIEDLMYRKISELSGGERQMVLICRSLIKETDYILMDEPTSALDYSNQIKIMEVVRDLSNQGKSVIMSTHNPSLAMLYSDDTVILNKGQVFAIGETSTVLTKDNLETIYKRKINVFSIDGKTIIYP